MHTLPQTSSFPYLYFNFQISPNEITHFITEFSCNSTVLLAPGKKWENRNGSGSSCRSLKVEAV